MKSKAWLADALIGLLLTGFVGAQYILGGAFLESLELKAYDARAQFRTDLEPKVDLVIVAIDDESITRLGRWPWPRTRIAEMLEKLKAAGPRVIGLDILYTEPERNPALAELEAMQARYLDLVAGRQVTQKGVQFETEFSSAAERLDTDKHLLASLTTTQNVILPMFFLETSEARGAKPPELPLALSSSTLGAQVSGSGAASDLTIEATKATYPLEPFIGASAGVGHVNIFPDLDGVVRRETLAVRYGASFYPSYALALVARSLGYGPNEVVIEPGRAVKVGKIDIPLDESQSMLVTFNGPERTFRYFPFYEVLEGKVPADVFKDKIVILGPSAQGVGTVYVTPVAKSLPSVEFIANVIENVMNRRFLGRPAWAFNAEAGAILVIGLFVMFGLPRLRALGGAFVTLVLMVGLGFAGFWAFKERGEWIKVVYPAFLLGAGYVVIVTRRFFKTEQGKERVEASQIDDFKLMGLSYQGKGDLDLAFAKFRLVPVDVWDEVFKDTLYNLGLDFERKRQYAKAVQVYKHIESAGAPFKDTVEKVKTLSAAAEGAVFGGVGKQTKEGTVIVTGGATKATLGRYEIEKELGRGAMGIVYLGKDPKINRQVAIKTLMMEEGSSEAEVKEVKERFFREAESAGTLNHPGIVRVFDAGEENDVCYIAMELLTGEDLVKYGRKGSLLAPETAMDYVARIAEALDYAHQQGVVHRDIKPANIMLLKDGSLRVTDFGIARIQASSKTATGTVMGTPSYMSPEQISGKKVDGRSDLFSLGVTLYELLTGEKPWKGGEAGIGTLLFQIANDPEPNILEVNPALPPAVKRVVAKALAKKAEERYARGNDFAKDIRAALADPKGAPSAAPVQSAEDFAASLSLPPEPSAEPTSPVEPAPAEIPVAAPPASDKTVPASDWAAFSAAAAPAAEPEPVPAPDPEPAPAPEAQPDADKTVLTSDWAAFQAAPAPAPAAAEETLVAAAPFEPEPAAAPADPVLPPEPEMPAGFSITLPDVPVPASAAPAPSTALGTPGADAPSATGIELGSRPAFGAPPPPAAASGIELGPRPGLGAPPPPPPKPAWVAPEAPPAAAGGIELGPRPGLTPAAVPPPAKPAWLNPEPAAAAPAPEPTAPKPAAAFTPEEVAATLTFDVTQLETPAAPPAPAEPAPAADPARSTAIEPPFDPGETIKLFDPRKPQ